MSNVPISTQDNLFKSYFQEPRFRVPAIDPHDASHHWRLFEVRLPIERSGI